MCLCEYVQACVSAWMSEENVWFKVYAWECFGECNWLGQAGNCLCFIKLSVLTILDLIIAGPGLLWVHLLPLHISSCSACHWWLLCWAGCKVLFAGIKNFH